MPSSHELNELRTRAEQAIEQLHSSDLKRPMFIEFAGTPKSGKSTCIETISHFFRRCDGKVLAPAEGASRRTPYYLRNNWMAFNTWSASYALMYVLEGLHGSDQYDLVLLDRGLFDALAWFEFLASKKKVTDTERDHVQNFLQIEHWRTAIDVVCLFKTDPVTAMKRENAGKLTDAKGSMMNEPNLGDLNDAYDKIQKQYEPQFAQIKTIDTSGDRGTDPADTAAEVAHLILDALERRGASGGG